MNLLSEEEGKIRPIILAVFIIATSLITQASAVANSVHNIDTGETFTTITQAMEDADTLDGHTLRVDPGTYNESVYITKRLTIESTSGVPGDTLITHPFEDVVSLYARGAVVRGFTIEGNQTDAGFMVGESYCIISDCIIRNNYRGIDCDITVSGTHLSVLDNIIENNLHHGIQIDFKYSTLTGNVIRSNATRPLSWGLEIIAALESTVTMNVIEANAKGGLNIQESDDCEIIGNTIIDNGETGFVLNRSKDCIVTGNTMSGNTCNFGMKPPSKSEDYNQTIDTTNTVEGKPVYYFRNEQNIQVPADAGFFAAVDCENVTGDNVTISDNENGILLARSKNCSFQNMTLTENRQAIYLMECEDVSFSDIQMSSMVGSGAYARKSSRIYFDSCEAAQCYGPGISFHLTDDGSITNCLIEDCDGIGVILSSSENNEVANNEIRGNAAGGIHLNSWAVNNRIENNTLENNEGEGIVLVFSPANEIIGNTIHRTLGEYSEGNLYLNESSSCIVTGNDIRNGETYGVRLSKSNKCLVEDNKILNQENADGIFLHYAEDNQIRNNLISGNGFGIRLEWAKWNKFRKNVIAENGTGMTYLLSSFNKLIGNTFLECFDVELTLDDSYHNEIYHNDFLAEDLVVLDNEVSTTAWDNGYPSGGNYWSDYQGVDLNNDGIGDTPKEIMPSGNDNYDNYPLMVPANLTLFADRDTLSETTGGQVTMSIEAGLGNAFRKYLVVGGVSGTEPGQPLPGGLATLPVNFDSFTYDVVFLYLNTLYFKDFLGLLDADGRATPVINAPPMPGFLGTTMHYAFCCSNPFDFASNYISVSVIP